MTPTIEALPTPAAVQTAYSVESTAFSFSVRGATAGVTNISLIAIDTSSRFVYNVRSNVTDSYGAVGGTMSSAYPVWAKLLGIFVIGVIPISLIVSSIHPGSIWGLGVPLGCAAWAIFSIGMNAHDRRLAHTK